MANQESTERKAPVPGGKVNRFKSSCVWKKWREKLTCVSTGAETSTPRCKKHKSNSVLNSAADAHLNAAGYELDAASEGAKHDTAVIRF